MSTAGEKAAPAKYTLWVQPAAMLIRSAVRGEDPETPSAKTYLAADPGGPSAKTDSNFFHYIFFVLLRIHPKRKYKMQNVKLFSATYEKM